MNPLPSCLLRIMAVLVVFIPVALQAQAPGSVETGYDPNVGGYASFTAAMQPDGKTIIGGDFQTVGGTFRSRIARLRFDGTLDIGFNANVIGGSVETMAVQADGKIVIGGQFYSIGGAAHFRIARLNADGTPDTGFNPSADSAVYCVAAQADGKILVGGDFFTVNGTARKGIARLNANGTLDPGFNPDANGAVLSVAVQANGTILIGGTFTTVGGTTRHRIARLNASGTLDPAFDPDASNEVDSVAVQADGRIILGGAFTSIGGTARHYIARLNANGTLDASFNPDADSFIKSVAVQADGKILLGGYFTTVGGTARHNLAQLNANGTFDASFDPDVNSEVRNVVLQADGRVLLGGQFTTVGGTTRSKIARLYNAAASAALSVPNATQLVWSRAGAAPEVGQVAFELSTDGGSTWSPLGAGARVGTTANWQRTGLSLPASGLIRARAWIAGGSSGLVESITSFPDATTTQPPMLTLPFSEATQRSGSSVTFNLPEAAQLGSVKVRYRHVGNSLVEELLIGPAGESVGTHSFVLDPAMPTSAPMVAAGGPIADGAYHVEVAYRDALGNPEAVSAQALNVIVDTLTQVPILTDPASHATTGTSVLLQYTLPERAKSGSVQLTFDDGMTQRVWTVDDSEAGAGLHLIVVNPASPTSSAIATGTAVPEGRYTVHLSYQDAVGNGPATATSTDFGFDFTALPPPMNSPATGNTYGPEIAMQYSLPEPTQSGSVKLNFIGPVVTVVTLDDAQGTAGPHTFTLNALNLGGSTAVAGVSGPTELPDGSYSVVLQYSDTYGNPAWTTATDVIMASAAYTQWKLANFNDLNAPDLGNADNDAYANLAEYGLVLSPTAFSTGPVGERHAYPEGDRLRIIFTRDPARNDVTIEAQAADDLAGPWATIASSVLGAATTGAGYYGGESAGPGLKTVEVRDVFNNGNPTHPHRFLRLQVSH